MGSSFVISENALMSSYFVHPFHGQTPLSDGPCRILFIVGQLGAGGLEQQICYLLKGMDRKKYLPSLAVWNYKESDVHVPAIKALEVPTWGYPLAMSSHQKLFEISRLTRQLSPEVVHSYTFFTNFAASWAARRSGSIAVGSIRNELDLDLIHDKPLLGRMSAAWPRFQISNSHAAARRIESIAGWFKPKRLSIVQNGLDMDRFHPTPSASSTQPFILGVGTLVQAKRWDRLLRLALDLKRSGVDCRIQIAGDGPLRSKLEALAVELGVADRTQFLGHRSDVAGLLGGARLLVHPSDGEGTPNVIMEAMAAGRPVVATDVGDVSRIVQDTRTGFVVPRDDPSALLDRVRQILTNDALALRMGQSAQAFAQREFSLSRLVTDTFEAYRSAGWKTGDIQI